MKFQFIGCGDAFGSGGRFNTCFHITDREINFLLDCGASSLISLKSKGIVLNDISLIIITHFHADHFGGIPFFLLDAHMISKRTQPLIIAGPSGIGERYKMVMDAFFPGSLNNKFRFDLTLVELEAYKQKTFGKIHVTPFSVNHDLGQFFSYRIVSDNKTISFTGDTEWTDTLIEVGKNADLFIAESYFYDKKVKYHLNYKTLMENMHLIKPKHLILSHMSDEMLAHLSDVSCDIAEDGKIIEL